MMQMLTALSVALFVAGCALADDVIELKDDTFDDGVKDYELVLAEFYAPWCGHCKRLAPEYEKAATKLKDNDPPIGLVKVDCTAEKKVCERFGVSGYPTLKIFRKGEVSQDYDGPREADGIVKYMRAQSGPSSKELNSLADFEKFLDNEEHGIIGFFEEETKLYDSFHKVADTERDRFRFGHTSNKDIIKKAGYTDDIVIYAPKRLHNKFEEGETRYDGNYDTDKIKKFIVNEMQGLCGIREPSTAWQFDKRPLFVAYYNVDYVKDPKGTNYWRNRVLKVAKEYQRKAWFAVSAKGSYLQEIEEYGLASQKESDKPIVAAMTNSGKFPMKDDFSPENLKKFVDLVLADKAESYMKSEPVPTNNDGPVKIAVGRNYKKLIEDADADVLIEFYAPWCGHCKKLTPIYDELGEKLAGENVIIAKMDATANDAPPKFEVKGFPTIYWVPKNDKNNPRVYSSGRELDDFIKWVARESTDELKKYTRDGRRRMPGDEL